MPGPERQAARIQPFVAPCRYAKGEVRVPGFLTDLSKRGCRVHTDHDAPAAGTELTLEVRLGSRATHLRIPGTVRWTRPNPRGGFVFGLSFDGIGADEQRALDAVVDEFRRRAAALG